MEKPFVLPVWLQSPKVTIFCTFNANSKCCGVHSSAISNTLVNWVWNVAEWLAKLCTERRHTQWARQLVQDWIRMQTVRKSHMVSVRYGSVYEGYEGVILTVLGAERESLAPELTGVGLWIDLAPRRLICLDGSRNYSIRHLLQPVAAGLAASEWVASVTCPCVGRLLAVFPYRMPFFCHHLWNQWLYPFPVTDSLR